MTVEKAGIQISNFVGLRYTIPQRLAHIGGNLYKV
jgi:hypothetical protein